jgi:XTP/dITP diphosphohydrolase
MKEIVFATSNNAKINQINFIINHFNFPVKIIPGKDFFGDKISPIEKGSNVMEIALNSAIDVSNRIGLPVIAEDTDFQVKALNGKPGIKAGDYLKKHGRRCILKQIEGAKERDAIISSAVAYVNPDGTVKVFSHIVEGIISNEESFCNYPDWISPSNENIFGGGYNAIFIPKGKKKTLAEIDLVSAISFSYREVNFVNLIDYILNS